MADNGKNAGQIDAETDAEERLRRGFLTATGQGGGTVRVERKDPKTGRRTNCGSYEVFDGNFDAFIDELRNDYPDGGDFICRLVGDKNAIITNGVISIEPNRRARAAQAAPAPAVQGESNMEKMMMMMMQMQEASANRTLTAMTTMVTAMIGRPAPAMENPIDLVSKVFELQGRVAPAPQEDTLEKTLALLERAKALLPESGGGSDGLMGLIERVAPAVVTGLAVHAQQQAQAPAQAPQVQVVNRPLPAAAPGQTVPQPAPVAPETNMETDNVAMSQGDDMQAALFAKFHPIMTKIKSLLDLDFAPDGIANYIDDQVQRGNWSEDDVSALVDAYIQFPDMVGQVLAMYGITSDEHREGIGNVISILTGGVDSDDESDGGDGHQAGS